MISYLCLWMLQTPPLHLCSFAWLPQELTSLYATNSLLIWTNIFASTCLLTQFQHRFCMKSSVNRVMTQGDNMTQNYNTAHTYTSLLKLKIPPKQKTDLLSYKPRINATSLPEHLDCGWVVSDYSSVFQAGGYADQTINTCSYNLPVYGEHHLL